MDSVAALAPSSVAAAAPEKPVTKKATPAACAVKFKKTAMCRYYPKCSKGEDCLYAHSEAELRSRPNFTKTRMCAGYRDGRCKLPASECPFAHGRQDLRNVQAAAAAAPQEEKRRQVPMPPAAMKPFALPIGPPPGLDGILGDGALTPTASGASTPSSFAKGSRSGASTPPMEFPSTAAGPSQDIDHLLAVLSGLRGPAGATHFALEPREEMVVFARFRI